jgi:hypothetical protein
LKTFLSALGVATGHNPKLKISLRSRETPYFIGFSVTVARWAHGFLMRSGAGDPQLFQIYWLSGLKRA